MGVAEHFLVARRPLRIGPDQIRKPPRLNFADEQHSVADPQPVMQPPGIRPAEIFNAEKQADSKKECLNQGDDEKILYRNFTVDGVDVIEPAERYPIVERQKQDLKYLQRKQGRFEHPDVRVRGHSIYLLPKHVSTKAIENNFMGFRFFLEIYMVVLLLSISFGLAIAKIV